MKGKLRRLLAAVMAVAIAVPMGITASAATTYNVDVTSSKMYLLDGSQTKKTYSLENTDLRVMLSTKNNTLIGFTKSGSKKETNVSLGAQKTVTISGSMNSLTVSPSFPADRTVTVNGKIGTLTVNSAAQVILSSNARVSNLKVTHKSATVTGKKGCEAVNVTSVSGATVTGVQKVSKLSASSSSSSKPANTTTKPSSSSSSKISLYADAEERSSASNTKSIDFNDDTLYIEAKSGVKLGTAIKDVKLTAYRSDTDEKVAGTWKWVQTGATTTTKSGKYDYRFTPTNTNAYKTMTLTVDFTGNGDSSSTTLGKPSLSFEDRSHGDGDFEIRVGIPYGLGEDAKLIIYVDGKEYDEYWLDEGDEGDDETYSVKVDGDSGDKFKIKVKVQRIRYNSDDEERTGSSKTSRTITYEID